MVEPQGHEWLKAFKLILVLPLLFLMDISLFMEPLITLFWTSDDVCPWFQNQGGSLAYVLHRHRLCIMDFSDSPAYFL